MSSHKSVSESSGARSSRGVVKQAAEEQYGENPDYYDGFFVPEHSRWSYLQERLNDARVTYGSLLDKALVGLSESNESLEHVLDHIMFMRTQGNKRVVSDDACKDLVRHFNRYRLCDEDFQFSDLLGSAYEFLINPPFSQNYSKSGMEFPERFRWGWCPTTGISRIDEEFRAGAEAEVHGHGNS